MKKLIYLWLALVFVLSITACGSSRQETADAKSDIKIESETASGSVEEDEIGEVPSGINEDGMGEDPSYGEGIGEVIALSDEETAYMMAQTTNTWLEMSPQEKDDLVVLVGRSLEESYGFVVPDYEDMVAMLDHQMEQYYRNGVDENVLDVACDIYGIG